MHQKFQTRAFAAVAPILLPGEQPITATRTVVGGFASGRISPLVRQALVTEGMGALGAAMTTATGKQFVVLTDRRLIFLSQTWLGGPGKKIVGEVPRQMVSLAEVKIGIVSLLRIAFGDQGQGVALTFPRVDQKNAKELVAALGNAPVA
jgi:hypothetical protein